jgi:hypothetical protein
MACKHPACCNLTAEKITFPNALFINSIPVRFYWTFEVEFCLIVCVGYPSSVNSLVQPWGYLRSSNSVAERLFTCQD